MWGTLDDTSLSLKVLLENQQQAAALNLLRQLQQQSQTDQHNQALADLYLQTLSTEQLRDPLVQPLFLGAMCMARRPERILEYLQGTQVEPALELYRAWALLRCGQHTGAVEAIERVSEILDLGLYWRVLGEARFHLGHPDWSEAFEQAKVNSSGVSLGRTLLDYGHYLNLTGQRAAARVAWAEALEKLRADPFYLAWVRHNLGFSLIKDRPAEAEVHFLEAVRLSRRNAARGFACRAQVSLAALRRSLGELERALSGYQQALRAHGDVSDRQQAMWGYGHTLRLLGRPEEALGPLLEAARLDAKETWIHADIAACRLMLGDEHGARESLRAVKRWGERSKTVRAVVEAELRRRQGQEPGLCLEGLDPANLWVREELSCFPAPSSRATADSRCYRVHINPWGLLEVEVNGRRVPINPLGKPGELLVFMVVHGGAASLELLTDRLCADALRNKPKALWEHVKALRLALGWPDSVQAGRGIYRLDPATEWVCAEQPLPLGSKEFLHGHYSDWVLERRPLVF